MDARILLVDDDKSTLSCMGTFLSRARFETVQAESGEEALEYLSQRNRVNLVLMDVKMPGMGGLEALRRMRILGSEVPVILMSGYGRPETVEESFPFMDKPIEPEMLLEEILQNLTQRT